MTQRPLPQALLPARSAPEKLQVAERCSGPLRALSPQGEVGGVAQAFSHPRVITRAPGAEGLLAFFPALQGGVGQESRRWVATHRVVGQWLLGDKDPAPLGPQVLGLLQNFR